MPLARHPRRHALILLVVLATGACGSTSAPDNGEAAKPGTQIIADAVVATQSVHSFHAVLHAGSGSAQQVVDAHIFTNGDMLTTWTYKGVTTSFLQLKRSLYINGTALIITAGGLEAADRPLLTGHWETVEGTPEVDALHELVNTLTAAITPVQLASVLLGQTQGATKLGRVDLGSAGPAVKLSVTLGRAPATVYVAATGKPYVMRIEHPATAANPHVGTAEFSGWNAQTEPTPPA